MTLTPSGTERSPRPRRSAPWVLGVCFFLSGATGLVYEVVWLRLLGLVFGHTVHAITTVLTAFMAGLALGGILLGRYAGRASNLIRTYGWLEIGIAVCCGAIPGVLVAVGPLYLGLQRMLELSPSAFGLLQFVIVVLALMYCSRARSDADGLVGRPIEGSPGEVEPESLGQGSSSPGWTTRATLVALGISGAVSMIYEIAWSRALALVIGSSTYAFTAMLVAFLVGIGGGGVVYLWRHGNRRSTAAEFAVIQGAIGITAALSLLALGRVSGLFLLGVSWSDAPGFVEAVQVAVSVSIMLLPTLLIGATFPCAVAVVAVDPARIGREVGMTYAVNTAGAIVGTVIAGFVLIPALGAHAATKLGIIVNLLLAAGLLAASLGRAPADSTDTISTGMLLRLKTQSTG